MPALSESKRRLNRAEKWLFASPLLLLLLIGSGALGRDGQRSLSSIAFAPDGALWSGYYDTSVSVQNIRTGKTRRVGVSHDVNAPAFALSPDGKRVATQGDAPGWLALWDTRDGHLLSQTKVGDFIKLHFSPDGKLLANEGQGCSVSFFDGITGKKRNTLTDTSFVSQVLLRDSNTAFAWLNGPGERLHCLGVRDTRTGAWLRVWKRGGPELWDLAASRDRKWVAASSDSTFFHPHDHPDRITLFDARTGRMVRSLWGGGIFYRLTFSPDGTRLAAALEGGSQVRVWDVATGRELFRVEHPAQFKMNADNSVALAWSPDGKTLATTSIDAPLLLWDGHTGAAKPLAS